MDLSIKNLLLITEIRNKITLLMSYIDKFYHNNIYQ